MMVRRRGNRRISPTKIISRAGRTTRARSSPLGRFRKTVGTSPRGRYKQPSRRGAVSKTRLHRPPPSTPPTVPPYRSRNKPVAPPPRLPRRTYRKRPRHDSNFLSYGRRRIARNGRPLAADRPSISRVRCLRYYVSYRTFGRWTNDRSE